VYLLHQLLGEEQLRWLRSFNHFTLSDDEAKALILAKETGAVDNAALRAVTGLDTLAASQVLRRLHYQRQLLVKGGAGPATYYQLDQSSEHLITNINKGELEVNKGELEVNKGELEVNKGELEVNVLPSALQMRIKELTPKARKDKLWPVILWLCAIEPLRAEILASLLRRQVKSLKANHLTELREHGFLSYLYPEVINHPEQAYKTTDDGVFWLQQQGIAVLSRVR
jgi:ATP-dependent DNA helicase RecG